MNGSITAQILDQAKVLLHADLEPKELLKYLIGVLNDEDRNYIGGLATRKERVDYFIPCYVRLCSDIEPLLKALRSNGQPDLESYLVEVRSLLVNQQPDTRSQHLSAEELEIILRSGDVPQKLVGFVARPKLLTKFKAALRHIQSSIGWVLFYGMGGSGKSVFAAASMHDPEIIGPGQMFERVFWLRVGKIEETAREPKVKSILHSLLVRLDPDFKSSLTSLDEGRTRVQKLLLDRHPRCLLIFDDVWSPEVVQLLNLQCRTLIISRHSNLLDVVSGTVEKVAIDEGFSVDESLEAFAKMLNMDKRQLPSEATEISHTCGGLPFAIALIASLLKENPKRWEYYLKLLKDPKQIAKIKRQTSYAYATVFGAVDVSVEDLKSNHKDIHDLFLTLVVFHYAQSVPIDVLSLYWDQDQEESEDVMNQICNRSLAIREMTNDQKPYYVLHDIIKSYLSATCADKKQDCHVRLIDAYKRRYTGGYHTFPNDNYIQRELGTHLYEAKLPSELPSVLLNLKFIQQKLKICGPTNTLGDIVKFWNILIKEKFHEKSTVEFYQFVSRNASHFVDLDPIQLALLESNKSAPCAQAKKIVAELMQQLPICRQLYFQLVNKKARRDHLIQSSMRPHSACVKTLAFLPHGSLFVSGGVDNTVKLSHIRTGEEIASIGHQLHPVSRVCLNSSQKKVVVVDGAVLKLYDISQWWDKDLVSVRASGGSEDTRKVLTPPPKKRSFDHDAIRASETELVDTVEPPPQDTAELMLFGHEGEILWCEFAKEIAADHCIYPLLASCGTDNTVRIWDLNVTSDNHVDKTISGKLDATSASKPEILSGPVKVDRSISVSPQLLKTLTGHTGAVKYCRFAPDNCDLLVSAAEDRTVRIWSISKGTHLQILEHSSEISFLCWSPAGVSKGCIITIDGTKLAVWQKLPQEQLCFSRMDEFELVPGTKATSGMISPDGETLAIGFSDGNVEIWDLQKVMKKAFSSTCKLSCLTGHCGPITSLCYSADSKGLLTAADDSVMLWSTEPTEIGVTLLPPYATFVRSCDHSPMILARSYVTREVTERDSSMSTSDYYVDVDVVKRRGGQDHLVLLEGPNESICQTFKSPNPTAKITCVAVTSNGDFAAVGYDNGQVFGVDIDESAGTPPKYRLSGQMLSCHSGSVDAICFSYCNNVFVTCGSDGFRNVYRRDSSLSTPSMTSAFQDAKGLVNRVVFFPHSCEQLLICSENGSINVWNCTASGWLKIFSGTHGGASVLDCDVSPDGRFVVSASSDFSSSNCAAVWNVATLSLHFGLADAGVESPTGTNTLRRPGRSKSVVPSWFPARCCRFSATGSLVAVGFDSGRVQIWSVVDKMLKSVISANPLNEWVRSLRISPDESMLVTAGYAMLKWWCLDGTSKGKLIGEGEHLQKVPLRAAAVDYLFVNDETSRPAQTTLDSEDDLVDGNAAGVQLKRQPIKPLAPFSLFVAVSKVGSVLILKRLTEADVKDY